MLLNKHPIQCALFLYELALRGDRGLSSYRAYMPDFPVKWLGVRIFDLQEKYGCKIRHEGSKEATYYLISVPPETVAILAQGEPELMGMLDHYPHVDSDKGVGNLPQLGGGLDFWFNNHYYYNMEMKIMGIKGLPNCIPQEQMERTERVSMLLESEVEPIEEPEWFGSEEPEDSSLFYESFKEENA